LRTNIGNVATVEDAAAAFNPAERVNWKTITYVRPWGTLEGRQLVPPPGPASGTGEAWHARRRRHRRSQALCRKPLTDRKIPGGERPRRHGQTGIPEQLVAIKLVAKN
jgi:hypothetical protein